MANYYTTEQDVRDILGVNLDDASDDILREFISKAQVIVLKHIQVPIMNELMDGTIDGTNNSFTIDGAPFIADRNYDKQITKADIEVYTWTDADDEATKNSVTVQTFYPDTGLVILETAPGTTVEQVTISYSYYTCKIDWDLVSLATSYYAAMMWVGRELYLVPERVFLGELRLQRSKGEPWETFRREFRRIIDLIVALPMEKVEYDKMVTDPRDTVYDQSCEDANIYTTS